MPGLPELGALGLLGAARPSLSSESKSARWRLEPMDAQGAGGCAVEADLVTEDVEATAA